LVKKIIKTMKFSEQNILMHKNKIRKAHQLKCELSKNCNV